MRHITARDKLRILRRVLRHKESVSAVCRDEDISRKTFYSWKGKYLGERKSGNWIRLRRKSHQISERIVSTAAFRRSLLNIVVRYPGWSVRRYATALQNLGFKISHMSVLRQLRALGLEHIHSRQEFSQLHSCQRRVVQAIDHRHRWLLPRARKMMVEEALLGERSVDQVCRDYRVSRKTFYKWKKRYQRYLEDAKQETAPVSVFTNRHLRGYDHPLSVSPQMRERILHLVIKEPKLSVHTLAQQLVGISSHGVANVLSREGLNTSEMRVTFSLTQHTIIQPAQSTTGWLGRLKLVFEEFLPGLAPAPPPFDFAQGRPLFFLRRLSPFIFFSIFIFIGLYGWGYLLGSAQTPSQAAGFAYASLALSMGSIFFLYSLKYYFTLAVVLSFSREVQDDTQDPTQDLKLKTSLQSSVFRSPTGWLGKLFGIGTSKLSFGDKKAQLFSSSTGGLEPDLTKIELMRHPFISVHLPMYNEKRVAERLLIACTSFDYDIKGGKAQYEIVVADDSTDETTAIVRQFADQWNKKKEERNNTPLIKVIHRDSREGFKGGALREALRVSDPRAEFVVVFDADFVPYPDTLELFLKYFQINAGSLSNSENQNTQKTQISRGSEYQNVRASEGQSIGPSGSPNLRDSGSPSFSEFSDSPMRGYQDSNIAAIQGYQWHVLNKSENWITRGVRSEYAGSYVIERSGAELYGGLKQIA